jgi:hypothetical protein
LVINLHVSVSAIDEGDVKYVSESYLNDDAKDFSGKVKSGESFLASPGKAVEIKSSSSHRASTWSNERDCHEWLLDAIKDENSPLYASLTKEMFENITTLL